MTALNDYWIARGREYKGNDGYRLKGKFFRQQEALLVAAVAEVKPKSILEVGCGYGRVTRAMAEAFPGVPITALDLSAEQIEAARQHCAAFGQITFGVRDLYEPGPLPPADVAVASELFLHIPPAQIRDAIVRLLEAAPVLVHDFDPAALPGEPTGFHCFTHDYPQLYADMGLRYDAAIEGPHGIMSVSRC